MGSIIEIYMGQNKKFSIPTLKISCFHLQILTQIINYSKPDPADGGDALQFWTEAANILNKQSWTVDKGWSSSLGVWRGANNSSP
jgi:hypothetical protein